MKYFKIIFVCSILLAGVLMLTSCNIKLGDFEINIDNVANNNTNPGENATPTEPSSTTGQNQRPTHTEVEGNIPDNGGIPTTNEITEGRDPEATMTPPAAIDPGDGGPVFGPDIDVDGRPDTTPHDSSAKDPEDPIETPEVTTKEPEVTTKAPEVTTAPSVTEPADTTPPPHVHNWTYYDDKAPSCTEDGYKNYKFCPDCNESSKEVLPATNHTPVKDPAVEATCEKSGLTEGSHCASCETVITEQKIIPALEHKEEILEAKEATCEKPGLTEGKQCSVCKTVLVPQNTVTKDHEYENGVCKNCGAEKFSEGLEYYLVYDYYRVIGIGTCTDSHIIIPSTYEGLPVREIGRSAFQRTAIKGVTIPSSVEIIEDYAFRFCAQLSTLTIREGVLEIGASVFEGCSSLKNAVLPNSLRSISNSVFASCTSLESLTLPFIGSGANGRYNHFTYIFGATKPEYASERQYLIKSLKTVTVTGETEIPANAFYNCLYLESINLPIRVTSIGEYAFFNCKALKNVSLGDILKEIKNNAFNRCLSLEEIDLPSTLETIGKSAFESCSALTKIELPSALKYIKTEAFKNCDALTEITIPANISEVGYMAFGSCSELRAIYFEGTEARWASIDPNKVAATATVYFYSEDTPAQSGNYWHYENGKPTAWK